jgi:MFS transporter, BCD family, chlorophyll transporter
MKKASSRRLGGVGRLNDQLARTWIILGPRFLPFADAASGDLPLPRLLRLSLFQISVGMAVVLLTGTLNRVMIVELGVPTWLVALMVSLPLLFAPLRALIGFRSDHHRSFLGWRRVPYIWMGTLIQFGGLAIMPFALIVLSGDSTGPAWLGPAGAALAFLLVGAGLHTTQTAGLALATDLAPIDKRPRVVALLYVTLLLGMVGTSLVFGYLLHDFSQVQLIQVIQAAAVVTVVLNVVALWKQEARNPAATRHDEPRPSFAMSWAAFVNGGKAARVLVAVGLGTAAFSMQDILLEPYGGEILGLTVGQTTMLTALLAGGSLLGFGFAARRLGQGRDPYRLASFGLLAGLVAFSAVIFAEPLDSPALFRLGTFLIGFGGGLFAVAMLTASMYLAKEGQSGLALGAWGAVVATSTGVAVGLGGALRDLVTRLAEHGVLGPAMTGPEVGYSFVYHLEIGLLFATLVAIGPLVRSVRTSGSSTTDTSKFGLNEFPA